jgi:hypothetical protein
MSGIENIVTVTLSPAEWHAAGSIGLKRQNLRVQRGKYRGEYKDNGGTLDERNVQGAQAEYALAKFYGKDTLQDWCETKSFSMEHEKIPCDVGVNLHVRSTFYTYGRLVVHPYDPDNGVFILARVQDPKRTVQFIGWTVASEAKKPEHWLNEGIWARRPAFVLDNDLLRPMSSIPPEAVWPLPVMN